MTNKVNIKRLDSVTKNDTTATEQINDNFKALQEAIENTLSRDGTGPNYMDADLDMNSYRIINSSDPVEETDIVNLKYVEERIGGAVEASKTAVSAASQAANSAQSALVSSTNAINTLRNAEEQLSNTIEYVEEAKKSIDQTIDEAIADVKQQALDAAQESIDTAAEQATTIVIEHTETVIKPELNEIASNAAEDAANAAESAGLAAEEAGDAAHYANDARIWATGEDAEVEEIAPGEEEHSSRGYADLAMAIANTPEDVPVDTSKLLALQIIKGPKGDSSIGAFTGDNTIEGTLNVKDDSNHPLKITGLAGTSASGFQVVDSNGAGESDFEHYATGDRYGTRIANKSTKTGKNVNIDLYQTTAGKSVLDLSKPDTILAPQLLEVIYPVGSIYITTNATCPISDLGVGTWEKVGTSLVSGVNSKAAVVGNGMALGITADPSSGNFGTMATSNDGDSGFKGRLAFSSSSYGKTLPATGGRNTSTYLNNAFGITTDSTKSGLVANVSSTSITVNIFRRTM
jgi:hypothetical protein